VKEIYQSTATKGSSCQVQLQDQPIRTRHRASPTRGLPIRIPYASVYSRPLKRVELLALPVHEIHFHMSCLPLPCHQHIRDDYFLPHMSFRAMVSDQTSTFAKIMGRVIERLMSSHIISHQCRGECVLRSLGVLMTSEVDRLRDLLT
jgi:hypothetical protein